MTNDDLNSLVARKKHGEAGIGGLILERIAKDVYKRPRLYGFRSEDDVGEVFEHYWTRISGLVDRYEDIGCGFEAFLISSIRYMALSIRRQKAWNHDKDGFLDDDAKSEFRSCPDQRGPSGGFRRPARAAAFPNRDDHGVIATAFRRRMLFLCVKCANSIDDTQAAAIAGAVGLDEDHLLSTLTIARASGLGIRRRSASRRRGRDAAWLRMGASSRRLAREVDTDTRRYISEAIDRDRGLYTRAILHISRSSRMISNKAVSELLGVPKGTVDCGVGRIMRRYSDLYEERLAR
ncbi:MAG: hypothetical protein CVV47_05535 [Spirochaetae bacterium HGW-Spirochaetae-3]|jgi:hypothetical protein|nr:MAG: hypothetical protein CVV47_05535 [Spirochaetae bacterium HGW-Spirochaetae-3]